MDLKIKDLIYRQNNLVPKDKCKYFIDVFEKYKDKSNFEHSLKCLSLKFGLKSLSSQVMDKIECGFNRTGKVSPFMWHFFKQRF